MDNLVKIQLIKPSDSFATPDYFADNKGNIYSFRYGRYKLLKPQLKKNGYYSVCLHNHTYLVHRLIANLFIKNTYNKREVNHIDGNKLNNSVSNLEWVTSSENQKHAFKIGLQKPNPNTTKYVFKNLSTDEIFEGSVYELRKKYSIKNHQHFSKLIKGQIKSLHNIVLWKS